MARRTKKWTQMADGRDQGKVFLITEMTADKAERWALRALLAITNATDDEIGDDVVNAGMAGMAALGIQALQRLKYEVIKPLLDEMMECVRYIPPIATSEAMEAKFGQQIMDGENCQIEEAVTFLDLRREVLELHTGFSLGALSKTTESRPGNSELPQ